jgi:hypothetical protein
MAIDAERPSVTPHDNTPGQEPFVTSDGKCQTNQDVWRKKKELIITPHSELPDRCVKCNKPADGYRKKVKIEETSFGLFLFIGLLAALFNKTHRVEIGLCKKCRKKCSTGIILGVASVFVAFIGSCITLVLFLVNSNPLIVRTAMTGTIVTGVVLAITGSSMRSTVRARSIKADYIRIFGAGRKFLDSLPEFGDQS